MSQLVYPNLNYPARTAYCLEYVDRAFGINSGESTAWEAWLKTKFKHEDQNFPPLMFPVFFSGFFGEGHVAIFTPQGIYSSPYQANSAGHVVLSSIAEVERLYGVKFAGWSEDLTNVRIIEGEDMTLTPEQVNKICVLATNMEAKVNQNFLNNAGQELDTVLDNFLAYSESKQLRLDAQAYRAGQHADVQVLKPGTYQVK